MTNFELVSTLYRDFLLREPEEAGVNYWTTTLDSGISDVRTIINSIMESTEFQQQIQPIITLYSAYLLRTADTSGLSYWVNEHRNGLALEEIVKSFQASNEYKNSISNLDDTAWLNQLYNSALNREPDPEGLVYWSALLVDGLSREELVAAFFNDSESTGQQPARALASLLNNGSSMDYVESLLNRYIEQLESELEVPTEPTEPTEPTNPSEPEPNTPSFNLGERYHTGTSDASAAIAVGEALMLVADDEDQVLRLYERDSDGAPLTEVNLNDALGLNDTQEVDLEAVATYQGTHYWLGSHESSQRSMVFATQVTGDNAENLDIQVTGQFTDLANQLNGWDANNGHGLGENALGLSLGVNIEGATFIGDSLYLGLRSPLDNGFAQLIPVENAIALVAGEAIEATFGDPLRLDLDGRAVRSIEPAGDNGYLILAGPVDDSDDVGFGLYLWDGAYAVREIEGVDLNTLPDALTAKPESLFDVSITDEGVSASVLFDSGTVDWLEEGQESKDLPAEQQRFVITDIEFSLPDWVPQAGDIAITSVSGSEKIFQFVALKGISEGAEITFTDSGWTGDGFRASEGAVKWTAPEGGVAAGTVFTYTADSEQFTTANGSDVGNNGFNLSVSGDQVLAFVGEASNPSFIYAVQTNSDEWQDTADSSNSSALPPGLEEGVTAVAVGSARNAAFSGDGFGTADELLSAIGDPQNWSFEDGELPANATTEFQLGTMEAPYVPGQRDIGLAITEIWSGQSGADVTEDWFEITNRSNETLDFTTQPLCYDDDSADPEDAVEIQGLTSLSPGESAIVMVDGNTESVAEFRSAWSNLQNIDSLKIGYAEDASGLGGGGDAVTLWQGDPRVDGNQVAMEAYPDTDGFDAASWDVDLQAFTTTQSNGAVSSGALGGDNDDVPAEASPGLANEPQVDITLISTVQGDSNSSALEGENVTLEAIVTMVTPGLDGFFLQEEDSDNDDNAATSEGIFVHAGSNSGEWLEQLTAGDQIRISGEVSEYFEKTQLTAERDSLDVLANDVALPESQRVTMPFTDQQGLEAFEGMRVAIEALDGEPLVVTELYELGRYGEVTLSSGGRLEQFTEVNAPDVAGYSAWLEDAEARTIKVDDANSAQNTDPIIYGRNGDELSATNPLRGGDELQTLKGVLDYNFEEWKVQNVDGLDFTGPARPETPDTDALGNADITVASFNVLNYFNTLDQNGNKTVTLNGTEHDPRGANNAEEFARQEAKIVEAINTSGADVVGLMEIENNGYDDDSAIAALVEALNADVQNNNIQGVTWAYSIPEDENGNTISPGDDAIAVGMIYNSQAVSPVGAAATKTDGAFATANRAPLLQTFEDTSSGETFSVVVNHFKSKGSVVNGEEAIGDGQANNNPTRVEAAEELRDWLATQPTGNDDSDLLILGDLNAYAMEDPITTLTDAGFELLDDDYSYVFDGFWGSLDHALASETLAGKVTGTTTWHINADEASALDYNTDFTNDRQDDNLYADDAFRSSDHDPILVGLNLGVEA
ncbi:ExeM/NucH family extracellular endonuclease [Halomonas sp. ISL-56]|uniref:ExeM/NucH family extracellular endonuclease n=1 Tax=Halomonas sp. ISL-56 TaxID=2819149 RepID=UPI001BEAEFAA|nr:ExeM/NucH family extracellular endonuclease [Halomonas sp. ISL-56]MBT2800991.1 ExeM/NucH family extracellular endonuclease [Halomonas sp. ISL-56]